jgi:hypothetical protein
VKHSEPIRLYGVTDCGQIAKKIALSVLIFNFFSQKPSRQGGITGGERVKFEQAKKK